MLLNWDTKLQLIVHKMAKKTRDIVSFNFFKQFRKVPSDLSLKVLISKWPKLLPDLTLACVQQRGFDSALIPWAICLDLGPFKPFGIDADFDLLCMCMSTRCKLDWPQRHSIEPLSQHCQTAVQVEGTTDVPNLAPLSAAAARGAQAPLAAAAVYDKNYVGLARCLAQQQWWQLWQLVEARQQSQLEDTSEAKEAWSQTSGQGCALAAARPWGVSNKTTRFAATTTPITEYIHTYMHT